MQTIHDRAPAGEQSHVPSGADPWCHLVEYADGYTVRFGGGDPVVLQACLESFCGAVPPQRRRWNALTKTWWVDPAVERMLGSLSRWTARSFAPHRIQRASAPEATAAAWATFPAGDDAAEGWVLTASPQPRPEPRATSFARPPAPAAAPWGRPNGGSASPSPGSAGTASASARSAAPPPPSGAPLTARDSVSDGYAALWLRSGAPWPVVRAAYRALASIHHPDRGGDGAQMKDLNAAYALLRRREEESSSLVASATTQPASHPAVPPAQEEDDQDDGFSL